MEPVVLHHPLGDDPPKASLYYGQDVLAILKLLPDQSVQTVATSPPYWNLRDYGAEGQLGAEETPQEFVARLVEIFAEIRRVLRDDGTAWLNLGDTYAGGGRNSGNTIENTTAKQKTQIHSMDCGKNKVPEGLKDKDLVGIPWRVALALQADGWYLRSDIIWEKVNPMPESVSDRPTKAHEYIFLLSKKSHYFYDKEAIKESATTAPAKQGVSHAFFEAKEKGPLPRGKHCQLVPSDRLWGSGSGRNKRSVWTVTLKPYPGAHFATWPPELVKTMIKAGTSEWGCCPSCGAPWVREWVSREALSTGAAIGGDPDRNDGGTRERDITGKGGNCLAHKTVALNKGAPSCSCKLEEPVPCVVLDPFSGSATTGLVAMELGRDYIGIDINAKYLPLAMARLHGLPAPSKDVEGSGESVFDLFGGETE